MRKITPLWRRLANSIANKSSSPIPHLKSRTTYQSRLRSELFLVSASLGCTCCILANADKAPENANSFQRPSRHSYKYLICGGGIAAQEALKVFVEENQTDDLLLVSEEWVDRGNSFENITPIEPQDEDAGIMWQLFRSVANVFPDGFLQEHGKNRAELVLGRRVEHLDPTERIATLDDGTSIAFERCLIATGNKMPSIPIGKVVSRDASKLVSGAQTQRDWGEINRLIDEFFASSIGQSTETKAHFTVVGGGWMSIIVGAALVERGADVTFSYSEPAFLARYFPKYVASDLYSRLVWRSRGGVDSLSYSAVKYIIAREPYENNPRPIEAEVHVGTVFDAFSIIDFRTDHVVFAPTLTTQSSLDAPALLLDKGAFVANAELAVASDIYAAGSALCVNGGALNQPDVIRWSADHAKATGRHAAFNILGARKAYQYNPSLTVDLPSICVRLHVIGHADGLAESFGYFCRSKNRDEQTSGGQFEIGVVFCVKPAPLSHRGAAQKLQISGVTLWEGSAERKIKDVEVAKQAASELLQKDAMSRPELESTLDKFCSQYIGISLHENKISSDEPAVQAEEGANLPNGTGADLQNDCDGVKFVKPLGDVRQPSARVVWRRHKSARSVQLRADELLWVENEHIGAVTGDSAPDKVSQAYSDLLKRSAGIR